MSMGDTGQEQTTHVPEKDWKERLGKGEPEDLGHQWKIESAVSDIEHANHRTIFHICCGEMDEANVRL